ncbi:MAG: hypothetical protein DMF94_31675 [Acidobacteria bacterium]|nr:MAG: hypothetical protein DMF94_31675 [Acidobacteriota bacterium]
MTNLSTFVATARRHLTPIIDRRGNILYSSCATLRPGTVYLLGLNPGGDPHDPRHQEQTIDSALRALPSKRENEYLDVSWREQGIRRAAGQSNLQRRVQRLAEMLNLDLRDMCAANLIFARSANAETSDYSELAPICWPVHELILGLVQPRLIIAFGNSGVSPYAFLLSKLTPASETMFPSGHGSWRCRAFTAGGMRVAGLPHLSRYAIDRHPPVGKWLNALLAG